MKYLLSAITFLILALSSCANVPAATASLNSTQAASVKNSIEVVGGNEESLREFIRQWALPVTPDGTSQKVTFLIGITPKDIPYDLPAPVDSRIIGSVTGNWAEYVLIFETGLTPESVHEFYAQALKDRGWQASPTNEGGGLIASPDSEYWKDYCYGKNEALLSVQTQSISAEKTSIRLSLYTTPDPLPCNADPNVEPLFMIYYDIPALRPPKGVAMGLGSANSDVGEAQTTLTLIGDLSAAEVADFYNEQLVAAGWKMQDGGDKEGAAWSNWTFKDDQGADWIGSLIVVNGSPESNMLFAVVTIKKSK